MKKDLILKLSLTVLELTDILALLYYRKSELRKIKKTLGEQENLNQNPDNDNANDLDFRCNVLEQEIQEHEIKKLRRKRDRLIEELKKDTQIALNENSADFSKALEARNEALAALWKANNDLEALEALVKANQALSDYQSEDVDYNSETE